MPSLLIAIASYGTAQDRYLERLLAEYGRLGMPRRVVVLSDRDKTAPGADEVVAGLPSPNPYSLPFAHRKVFAENAERFDLFLYAEDDTLLTGRHIESFLDVQKKLEEDEIPGFVRSETGPEEKKYITSIHHHFRWLPETLVERRGELFAQLSNSHSGCFLATRRQLLKAISSGGFLVRPHLAGGYGMLETAASDIYTQCGLRRLICLSRIRDFIVPHLPNKYYDQMGIPWDELECQVRTLSDLCRSSRWKGSLFNPQTKAPGFRWSKDLYEKPDEELLRMIPASTKHLLSVGCGWGENEGWLSRKGIRVCGIPLDSVFADALRRRGIRAVEGPLERAVEELKGEAFDVVWMADGLHLVEDPVDWLKKMGRLLRPGGCLVAGLGNTSSLRSWLRDWRDGWRRRLSPEYQTSGVHAVSPRTLGRWVRAADLEMMQIAPGGYNSGLPPRQSGVKGVLDAVSPKRFILKARRA